MVCPICRQPLRCYSLLGRIEHVDNCLMGEDDRKKTHINKETLEDYFPLTTPFPPIRKTKVLSPTFEKFLRSLGLQSYLKTFTKEEIEPEILLQCSFKDLKAIGLRNTAAVRISKLRRQVLAVCLFMSRKSRNLQERQRHKTIQDHFLFSKIEYFHPDVVNYRFR